MTAKEYAKAEFEQRDRRRQATFSDRSGRDVAWIVAKYGPLNEPAPMLCLREAELTPELVSGLVTFIRKMFPEAEASDDRT